MTTGRKCKTYIDVLGVGVGTWLEVKAIGDVDQPDSRNEEAQNTREHDVEAVVLGNRVTSLSFELVLNVADPVWLALRAANEAETIIGVANYFGDITVVGTEGMQYDAVITQFNKSYPLQGKVKVSVILKPAYEGAFKAAWVITAV